MSEKLNIEQLVRTRLGEAELTPSKGAWKGIARKLRWKQFLRFNPGKFNIYYAGAILLVSAGASLFLWGEEEDPKSEQVQIESIASSPEESGIRESLAESQFKEGEEKSPAKQQAEKSEESIVEYAEEPDTEVASTVPEVESNEESENILAVASLSPIVRETEAEPLPFTYFSSSVQSGCAPLEVRFINQSKNASSYRWIFGTGDENKQSDPVYLFTEPGRFTVTLIAENHEGKASVSKRMIEVLPQPEAEFKIEEGLEGTDNHVVLNLLNYSSSASSYSWCLVDEKGLNCSQWSSLEFQPFIELKRITPGSRSVRLEVVSDDGCIDTASVDLPLRVESSEVKIKFATAFSPNPSGPGDGSFSPQSKRIDLFHPVYVEVPVEYRMRVFTRRGEMVFETQEVYQGWDGYIHQEQAKGDVYVWMVEGKWANGSPFSYHGDVTLVQNKYW